MKRMTLQPLTPRRQELFWVKVEPTGFCWNWTAGTTGDGYGKFGVGGNGVMGLAHRIAYTELVGPVPDGLDLDHLCRNRLCVNPDHLDPVTLVVNNFRIPEPIRGGRPRLRPSGRKSTGLCRNGHEYTPENTYTYPNGRTECRECKRAHKRKRRA